MSENRVDPTVAGLFLIGFLMLVFGIAGIQMFNDGFGASAMLGAAYTLILPVAFILLIFAYMAGKVGNAFAVALFAFIAVALFGVSDPMNMLGGEVMLFAVVAFFFIIFAIVALVIGAPKLLVILLFLVAFLYLFVGFAHAVAGDDANAYCLVFGIFGLLAFLVATYLAFALATQKAPVF